MCACAALADEYAMLFGPANTAFFEQMLTMSPPISWARRTGSAALAKANEPRGMIRYCRSQSSNVVSPSEPARVMPALLTSRSTPPKASTAAFTASATAVSSVTSATTPAARSGPPSSAATSPTFASSRSAMTTLAPSAASARAVARPMPEAAPVTTAIRPASGFGFGRRCSFCSSRIQYSTANLSASSTGA